MSNYSVETALWPDSLQLRTYTLAAVAKYATPHSGDRAALRAIGAGLAVHGLAMLPWTG